MFESGSEKLFCAIPARLGSKRVPEKNVRDLCGKPMLAYTIEAALDCGLFDSVYVCTESQKIADVAEHYGALVPELVPDKLCGDLIPSWKPCAHLFNSVSKLTGHSYDSLLCLQPTSPLRNGDDIANSVRQFIETDADYLLSVTEIDPHYFHWALQQEGGWRMVFGEDYLLERTELPLRYRPNGSIKIARLSKLLEFGSFFGANLSCIETPEERSVHIGTEFEFNMAEFLLSKQ